MGRGTEELIEYILVNYRWVFVCLFLLPASFIFDLWLYCRNYVVFKLSSAPLRHDDKVRHVQKQVVQWNRGYRLKKICTARPGWQTMSFRQPLYKNDSFKVEVNLVDILEVNPLKRLVRVEPLVTMGQLTATLKPLGWTIPVLPEIDDLTVGGLVMGTGVESSSHIYGLFQHICLSYEVVLSDGSVVVCSPKENAELFYGVPWSYGTLGILTAVEIQLVRASDYIKLTYEPLKNLDKIASAFEKASTNPSNQFVEMILFNKNEAVLMKGIQTNIPEKQKINSIGKWYKPWFFKHVENILNRSEIVVEYIPLRDYYHRHTKAIFWELQDIIPFGNNPMFRFFFGWMLPPKVSLLKLTQTEATKKLYENNHIIQDMLVPIKALKKSIELFDDAVKVYPIWLCPFNLPNQPGMVHPKKRDVYSEMYVDIGVYGVPKVKNFRPVETTRKIEKFVAENSGFQMLYADTYTTRDEFRDMFDHTLYDKLRKQLKCHHAFPEVYDKVNKKARY